MSEPAYRCGRCGGHHFEVGTGSQDAVWVWCGQGEDGCGHSTHAPSLTAAFEAISRKEPEAKT